MYKVYLDGENLDPDYGKLITESRLARSMGQALEYAKDYLKIIDLGSVSIIQDGKVLWEEHKEVSGGASYGLYNKGAHYVYLTENDNENYPMVSMSSWTTDSDPVTLREWLKTTEEAKRLRSKLTRMLVEDGYKLSGRNNE